MWRGAKETATFCRFWRFLASVARDCKRDIYSRFLHLARHTSPSLLITSLIYVILQHLIIYISVACLRSAFALWLHLVLACISWFFCYCFISTYAFACCSIAWFPSIVPVGPFLLAKVCPPTLSMLDRVQIGGIRGLIQAN